jgi:ATP-binding cassette subfamily F protein 3
MLLNVSNLSKLFGDELLFEKVSFEIDNNDKIGFIGSNGTGKTTLFKILTNRISYDEGEIFKNKETKIGYLEQYACGNSNKSVFDETLEVFSNLIRIETELEEIRYDIEHGMGELDLHIRRQQTLNDEYASHEGFFYKSKARSALIGLGFSEDELSMDVQNLSGGQRTRVELAKILLSDANLLLLDEPTNHLDIAAVEWLEDFLRSYQGAFIVISHDRYFLNKVTGKTFELDNKRFYSFSGNYSFYVKQKEIDRKTQERKYENTKKEIERLEAVVEQQRRWNREKNIRTAESKMKVIERLEKELDAPPEEKENMFYSFKSCGGGGDDVVIADNLSMDFGGGAVFSNADMYIKRGERIFLLGPNGCGKTTLLKILTGEYTQSCGEFKIGSNIFIGYYDQIQERLSLDKTIIDEVWDEYPNLTQTQIRNALAAFLFKGEDVFKQISALSGGERARVELVKLILKKVNFLILDEPTNHLDIEAREALEAALENYDGTMLVVSHDRYFIDKLSTRILHIEKDGITSFDGNYTSYEQRLISEHNEQAFHEVKEKKNDYQEQKKRAAEQRKIKNKFAKIEEQIICTEQKIDKKNMELCQPDIATDYVRASEITSEIDELNKKLKHLYEEWEELQAEIETMEDK